MSHKYRDSGMMGMDSKQPSGLFLAGRSVEAATDLVAVIREVKPQVAVTYDDFWRLRAPPHPGPPGAHLCAVAGCRAVLPHRPWQPWQVQKVYWTANAQGYDPMASGPACCRSGHWFRRDGSPRPSPSVSRIRWSPRRWTSPTSWIRRWMPLPGMPRRYRPTAVSSRCRTIWGARRWESSTSRIAAGAVAGPFDEQGRETDLFNRVSGRSRNCDVTRSGSLGYRFTQRSLARSYRLDHRRYPFASP